MKNGCYEQYNSSDYNKIIEDVSWMLSAYLFDELNTDEKKTIEELLEKDTDLKSEFELLKRSMEITDSFEDFEPSEELSERTLDKIYKSRSNKNLFDIIKSKSRKIFIPYRSLFTFAAAASIFVICLLVLIVTSLKNTGKYDSRIIASDYKSIDAPSEILKKATTNFVRTDKAPESKNWDAKFDDEKSLKDALKLEAEILKRESFRAKGGFALKQEYNPSVAANPETPEPVNPLGFAKIVVEGTAQYKFPSGDWKELKTGMYLAYLNCQIIVDRNSKIALDFGDVKVNARGGVLSSQFNLVQDPLNSDAAMIEMFNNSQVFIENSSEKNNITLRTPRSYVEVQKQASVEAKVNPNKDVIISVSEGSVNLASFKENEILRRIIRSGETTLINMFGEAEVRKNLNVNWVGNWAKTAVSMQDLTVEKPLNAGDSASIAEGAVGTLIANDPEINDVPFVITDLDVQVEIVDQIAVTVVDQKFKNTTNRTLEGIFFFPLPENAAISGFSMFVHGKEVHGEFVERKEARRIYDEYKYRRLDPALLEWAGGNRFKMSVFPILPDEEKRIKITYTQVLESEANSVKYVYPLVSDMLRNNPVKHFRISTKVSSGAEITEVSSESHLCSFASGETKVFNSTLEAFNYTPGRDYIVKYNLSEESANFYHRVYKIDGEKGYFAGFFTPEFEAQTQKRKSGKFLFLVDTSGSFNNELYSLQLAILDELIKGLDADDLFNVLIYDYDAKLLMNQYVEPTEENRKVVLAKLNTFMRLGSTNLRKAFKLAWENLDASEPTTIILLGDGISTQGEVRSLFLAREISEMKFGRSDLTVAQAKADVRVFPVAFGNTYDKRMLDALAKQFQGRVIHLTRDKNPQETAKELLNLLNSQMLTDVTIKIEGVQLDNIFPEKFPALISGQQISFVTEYEIAGGAAKINIAGKLGGKDVSWQFDVELPQSNPQNFSIGRFWAKLAIDDLQQRIDAGHLDSDRFIADIVDMSKKFSIASQHTSLLVLEGDEEFETWRIEQTQKAKEQLKLAEGEPYLEIVSSKLGEGARSNFKVRAKEGDIWVDLKTLGNKIPVDSVISVPFDSQLDVKIGEKVVTLTEKAVVAGTDIPEASAIYQSWLEKQGQKVEKVEVAPTPEEFNVAANKLFEKIQKELIINQGQEIERLRRIYANDLTDALKAINFFETSLSAELSDEQHKQAIKEQAEKFREVLAKSEDALFVQKFFENYLPKKSLKPVVEFSDKLSLNTLNYNELSKLADMRTGTGFSEAFFIEGEISATGRGYASGGRVTRARRSPGVPFSGDLDRPQADAAPEAPENGHQESADDDDEIPPMMPGDDDDSVENNSESENELRLREESRSEARPEESIAPESLLDDPSRPATEPSQGSDEFSEPELEERAPSEVPRPALRSNDEDDIRELEKSKEEKKLDKGQEIKELSAAEQLQQLISLYKIMINNLESEDAKKSYEQTIKNIKQNLLKLTVKEIQSASLMPERTKPYLLSQIIFEYTKFLIQQIRIVQLGERTILELTESGAINQNLTNSRKVTEQSESEETTEENTDAKGEKIDEQQKTEYLPVPENGTIVFALDCSYTMSEKLTQEQINALNYPEDIKKQIKTKFDIARLELINGLSSLKDGENYAIILFNRNFSFVSGGRIIPLIRERRTEDNIRELFESFAGARINAGVDLQAVLADALTVIKPDDVSNLLGLLKRLYSTDLFPDKNVFYLGKTVYIISDGHVSWSDDSTAYLKNGLGNGETVKEPIKHSFNADFWKLQEDFGLRIHTVGVGNHNVEFLRKIADSTGGKYLDTTGGNNSGYRTSEETLSERFNRILAELKKRPKNFGAWEEFTAWASSKLVDNQELAMQAFIAWASGDSGNHLIYEKMGEYVEKVTGDADSALRAFSTLVEINTTDPDARRFLGNFYRSKSMFEEAIIEYETARNLAWHIVIAYFNEADAAQNIGDYRRAIRLLTEIVEKQGQWPRRYNNVVQRACRSLVILYQQLALESMKNDDKEKQEEYMLEAKRWAEYRNDSRDLRFLGADIIIILDWDTDGTDVDLWLTYNNDNAKKCFYSNPSQPWGALLHEDQTQGFGPEYITVKNAPAGEYLVQVHYYSTHGFNVRSYCHVKVIFNVGKENQVVQEFHKKLEKGGDAEDIIRFKFPTE